MLSWHGDHLRTGVRTLSLPDRFFRFRRGLAAAFSTLRPFVSFRFWSLCLRTVQLKRMFQKRGASFYGEYLQTYYSRSVNPYYETIEDKWVAIRPVMIEMADLKIGERILDLGTGLGFQAAAFAACGYETLGVDFVPDRIHLARQRHSCTSLRWIVADATNLPFPDHSIDVVSVSLALHDMPVQVVRVALSEIRRVTKRRIVIAEPRLKHHSLLLPIYKSVACLLDESMYMKDFLDMDILGLFQEATLRLIGWKECFGNTLAVYACEEAGAEGQS